MDNKIGIYYAFWEREWNADYVRYIKKVKSLGYDILEIAAGALCDMSEAEMKRIAQTAAEEGITLTYCIGVPKEYDVASEDAQTRRNGVAFMKGLLERIHFMGGKMIGGIIYSCWPATTDSYESKMRARQRSIASVREIAKKAEELDIDYCLEIVNRFEQYIMNTVAEGVDYVTETQSRKVKLLLDVFHMNIEEDSFKNAIHAAKGMIGHVHIGETNRKTPGTGRMPWGEIASALRDVDYRGAIVTEPFIKPGGQVGRDIKIFRDLSGGCDEAEMDRLAAEAAKFMRDM